MSNPPKHQDGSPNERRSHRAATGRAKQAIKSRYAAKRTKFDVAADRLTRIASSIPFLTLHALWFGIWIAWNVGLGGVEPFDPFPFGLLTMVVSLEAIFLSIFVLIVQGREAQIAELREEITLQVILRMEEEVTKILELTAGLYTRAGHQLSQDPELAQMLQPLDEKRIEEDMLSQIEATHGKW